MDGGGSALSEICFSAAVAGQICAQFRSTKLPVSEVKEAETVQCEKFYRLSQFTVAPAQSNGTYREENESDDHVSEQLVRRTQAC